MEQLFGARINLEKVNKDKLFKGEKGTYLNIRILVKETENEYNQSVFVWEGQSQHDESPRNWIGTGRKLWEGDPKDKVSPEKDNLPF